MNAQLLNPFSIDIPDSVSTTLSSAECTVLLFNHGLSTLAGQYLAVGRSDGLVTIWDIETRSVLRVLAGHVRPVAGLAWSTYNRYLATCASDATVIIWDLAAKSHAGPVLRSDPATSTTIPGVGGESEARLPSCSERKATLRFDCAVSSVQFAPGDSRRLVVVLASNEAFLVDMGEKVRVRRRRSRPTPSASAVSSGSIDASTSVEVEDVAVPSRTALLGATSSADEDDTTAAAGPSSITAARFTPDARYIVAGTTKGTLLIFDASTGSFLCTSPVLCTSSSVRSLSFDAAGRYCVVNCNDRALRIVSLSFRSGLELALLHKVQDMVQRTPWTWASFTPSADYVYAGAAHKAAHNVYVWDRVSGVLLKMLEGPKDFVVAVDWHPHRPVVASASNTGAVYIWFSPADEIWSAYADGFEELDENVEYQEAEDEFDFDEHESTSRRRQHEQEAAHVRVTDAEPQHSSAASRRCELDADDVYAKLGIDGIVDQRCKRSLENVLQRAHRPSRDEGWNEVPGKQEEVRELEFTLLDDDDSDAFVIPPRLEIDYSDFHDDHL